MTNLILATQSIDTAINAINLTQKHLQAQINDNYHQAADNSDMYKLYDESVLAIKNLMALQHKIVAENDRLTSNFFLNLDVDSIQKIEE